MKLEIAINISNFESLKIDSSEQDSILKCKYELLDILHSNSRVLLYKLIQLVKNELIYVDTDSLFVTKKGYEILNNKSEMSLKRYFILKELIK